MEPGTTGTPVRVGDLESLRLAIVRQGGPIPGVPPIPDPDSCAGCDGPGASLWSDGSVWCSTDACAEIRLARAHSAREGFQVQFLDTKLAAVEIHLRAGGELVGEATVLTFNADTFLLATMMWRQSAGGGGAEEMRRVCASLVQEAVDLAEQRGAVLIAAVGVPDDLLERGFELNGSMWRRTPVAATSQGRR